MASHLWNQINSVKLLQHGTLQTYSSVAEKSQSSVTRTLKQQSLDFSSSIKSGNPNPSNHFLPGVEPSKCGRFVRNSPGPRPSDADLNLHSAVRYRIAYGAIEVAKNANDAVQGSRCVMPYKLMDGSDLVADEAKIHEFKRKYHRDQALAYLQPQTMLPFCRQVCSFDGEHARPTKFIAIHISRKLMSTSSYLSGRAETTRTISEDLLVTQRVVDNISARSDLSFCSKHSTGYVGSVGSADFVGSSKSVVSIGADDAIEAITPTPGPNQQIANNMNKTGLSTERKHVGFGYTQLYRPFSTFPRQVVLQLRTVPNVTLQIRQKHSDSDSLSECKPKFACGQKRMSKKDCSKGKKESKKKKPVYKHYGIWNKCECCPEMLPCDQSTYTIVDPFPCACEEYPDVCPMQCPPPEEPCPPPPFPLHRPPKCRVYQKTEECTSGCIPETCYYVEPKCLPKIESDCCCVEPYVPDKLPKMKFAKKRMYQCQPCPPLPCELGFMDMFVPPKKLPPIIPGDCPIIEHEFSDVPPLTRLNIEAYQETPECISPCPEELDDCRIIEPKTLPKIPCPCKCIEPSPLKPVKLVRLPPVCVCPPPPDPECAAERCPPRADDVCNWQFPKRRLKDWWCPKCRIPKPKYKWCHCHTRGHKDCREED